MSKDEKLIATIRRVYEAFNRGDFDMAVEIVDPDFELVTDFTNLRGAEGFGLGWSR